MQHCFLLLLHSVSVILIRYSNLYQNLDPDPQVLEVEYTDLTILYCEQKVCHSNSDKAQSSNC